MTILVTGVAGFVGSNLADALLAKGETVAGLDNLSQGSIRNLDAIVGNAKFQFKVVDLSDIKQYREAITELHSQSRITEIWHLAANSDIPAGIHDASVDFRNTLLTTFNTLELMRELRIPVVVFSSSSAIYGDLGDTLLTEDSGPLLPISNYGAMKLASEAMISAAVESHLSNCYVFRFPNVVGTPATHGVIVDFVRKLRGKPDCLTVLGNGTQRKSYLHVEELIDAMIFVRRHSKARRNVFNIGADDEGVTVRFIAEQVVAAMAPRARISYGVEDRGWVGDVPRFRYSIAKLRSLGWSPKMGSVEVVTRAVREIVEQELGR